MPILVTFDDLPVKLFAAGIRHVGTRLLAVLAFFLLLWLAWTFGSDLPWGV